MAEEKKDRLTMPALILTAAIAIIGNTDKLDDKSAGAQIVHTLITQMQTEIKAGHDARHAIRAQCEERQSAFEAFVENRLDLIEEDILIDDKEDHLPLHSQRFEPPELVHAEPPPAPQSKAPPVTVDQLLE